MDAEQLTALVQAAQKGEESAATALYETYQKDLYYHILKTVQDPHLAEDLLQDTFMEILATLPNLREPASFLAWSKQIAYHRCTAYFKKRRELLADEQEDGSTLFDTVEEENVEFIPDAALDRADFKKTIHAMIDSLPAEQRSALLLRYFDEHSVKEIAEIQGVTEGTVKSRLNYGRKAIKEAVEGYEKKHGLKLHCVGVVPLLLWLFRESAAAKGAALSAAPAAAKGAKAAGKFALKKLVAWLTAAAVTIGGVGAALLLWPEPQPMVWSGFVTETYTHTRYIVLELEERSDTAIRGRLEVSAMYDIKNDLSFEGSGAVSGEEVVYTLSFDQPLRIGTVLQYEYEQLEITYRKDTDTFSFRQFYSGELHRQGSQSAQTLAENQRWSGEGKDGFYRGNKVHGHLFTLQVEELTETTVCGTLTVSYNGTVDHQTAFRGRGYQKGSTIIFEALAETPRVQTTEFFGEISLVAFRLEYDTETQAFTIPSGPYRVTMEKN